MPDEAPPVSACAGCGAAVPGGEEGCRARFEAFLARDFSDPSFFRVHRMMVDAYCLQHPETYCKSAKSLAAHLVGLCQILEHGAAPSVGDRCLQQWLSGGRVLDKPPLPERRGELTVADLPDTEDAAAWSEAVGRWARSTWAAYEPLHPTARDWLAQAEAMG